MDAEERADIRAAILAQFEEHEHIASLEGLAEMVCADVPDVRSVASELRSEGFIKHSEGGVWSAVRTNKPQKQAEIERAHRRERGSRQKLVSGALLKLGNKADRKAIAEVSGVSPKGVSQALSAMLAAGKVTRTDDVPAAKWSMVIGDAQPPKEAPAAAPPQSATEPTFAVRSDGAVMIWTASPDGRHPEITLHASVAHKLLKFLRHGLTPFQP